ncbi:HAMP domain-containing protein [Sanguibacter gelidistatuariae]|uniref:histidine kinase n=1 Tax=Sanguibacter gelidistatuariae TaxID=1814289 RepID=A0A1G6NXT7_9MICO|nr:ATP-binding protein [Sanguibacter gelidistatuariae]SDC72047.1 HAMP domain-containing protein [Sanguibacter gelidistatuariae]
MTDTSIEAPAPPESVATLRQRLGITLVAAGTVLLLIVAGAVYSLAQVMTLQTRVTHTYFEAITFSEGLRTWLDDVGPAVDAYLSTGYRPALDAFNASPDLSAADVHASLVADLGTDSPTVASLEALAARIEEWHTTFAEPAIAAVAQDGVGAASPELVAAGEVLFAQTQQEADDLAAELARSRAVAADQLTRWTRNLFMTVMLLTVAALAAGLGVWLTLRRRILEPLADLASKAEAVSGGALTQEVRTKAPGEIASLAHAVDTMRVELVDQMAAAKESEKEIAEAHQHLTEQAEELRRSNRDLEQFAYVASHDLQEPLRKVASFTQLLQKRYGGELDERADQYIDFAVDGAKRMQRLIQDLLGFSRVGRSLDAPRPVDLADAARTAVATFDATIADQGAVVEVGELPTVVGQPTLLVQLFQNLVGNALKFRDPERTPQIEIGARRADAGWELWCTDNGIGIDAQYVDRVFVIFQRLHAKDVYDGTGIGLALCKKIVEYHGGEIWIDARALGAGGADSASSTADGRPARGTSVRWTFPDDARVP